MGESTNAESFATALARANLLRMRGCWQEAEAECERVLRRDPSNATAHSLLGDLYQDQGRTADAIRWYQMALDLDPGRVADRARLDRARESLEARQARTDWEAVLEGEQAPLSAPLLMREALQRIVAIVGLGAASVVLILAAVVAAGERRQAGADTAPDVTAPRPSPVVAAETRRERQLLRRLDRALSGRPVQVSRVDESDDPRTLRVRLFVPRRYREELSTVEYRRLIQLEAYAAAHALMVIEPVVDRVELSVFGPLYAPTGEWLTQRLFRADLTAANLVVDPDRIIEGELDRFYQEDGPVFWHQDLQVMPPVL